MTVGEGQRHGQQVLHEAGIESRHIDTTLLLEKVTGRSRSWLLAHPEEELTAAQATEFTELLERRAARAPLVHLTNTREFYGLDLYINEQVLTPRVETEKMVDYAINYAPKNSRLIDIGTGSGAIAIAIKTHRPDLEVWATDVSAAALEVARQNAAAHRVEIKLIESSLFDKVSGRFATVVSNLPYLRDDADLMPEVRHEPGVALFGGSDGLELYRRFLRQLPDHLEPEGCLFTECDPWQHENLMKAAVGYGFKPIEQNDYFILGFRRTHPTAAAA